MFKDPSKTQTHSAQLWDTINQYPKAQIKKFFTPKLIQMDDYAVKTILDRIGMENDVAHM